ncbi:hypothetical protein KBB96_16545 [Luteolibacter ambystomatis]|uniref:Uncharacterized protein n=1 Tax=Luteolibacter ambystomatis TaxID=2824561 RepID=A0A975IYQ0_9BACT|nr:hypothetical protein [Luteolibacter ambystomatis]QUE50462.1 hypothetical protein KBB96_16545 [Luteolibacter ambystomatis]
MTRLSGELSMLSRTLGADQPSDRRKIAQTLALALALDPANREARELMDNVRDGLLRDPADSTKAEKSKSHLWELLAWLESAEAGRDAQALAACLTDVAVVIDPYHDAAADHKKDTGAWNGWVPELVAYQPKEVKPVDPDPVEPTVAAVTFTHTTGTVSTPLWFIERDNSNGREVQQYVMKPRKITMRTTSTRAEDEDRGGGFKFILQGTQNYRSLDGTSDTLTRALRTLGDKFPGSGRVYLDCSGDYLVDANHKSISAAAALLMDSSVSAREPQATVMGIIREDGSFKLPSRAWDRLRSLSDGPGGRLILPREAEPLLASVLVMEDPAFYLKYEVLLAGSLKELVERADKGAQGTVAEVGAKFAEIQVKQGTMSVGQYAANRFVRQRLVDIAQAFPDHASARMLELQGSGKRPTWLPRPVLAAEVRRALEPVGPLAKNSDTYNLEVDTIEKVIEACRPKVEALERYTDMRDRDLTTRGKDLITALRNLAKARRDRDNENGYSRYQTAINSAKGTYEAVRRELDAVAADEDADDRIRSSGGR